MNKVYACTLLFVTILLASCTDDKQIGGDLQPDKDKLGVDTAFSIPIESNSFSPDSIQTSGLSSFLFGGYQNDNFGLTRSHMVTQTRFSSLGHIHPDSLYTDKIVLDSIKLILPYISYYGDTLSVNELKVYELNQPISNYQTYYSNFDIKNAYDETKLLGLKYYRAVANDSNLIASGLYKMEIPLDMSLAERLFNDMPNFKNDVEEFQQNYFNGLCIVSSFGTKTLLQVSPVYYNYVNQMRMALYYTDTANVLYSYSITPIDTVENISGGDSIVYRTDSSAVSRRLDFYVNDECARFSAIEHDFTDAAINPEGTDVSYQYNFLRGGGSLRTRIKFPNFRELDQFQPLEGQDSARIVINSAKITMSIDYNAINVNTHVPPEYLAAYVDNGETIEKVSDLNYGWDYFGGAISYKTFTYTINVADYVQRCLDNYNGSYDTIPDLIIGMIDDDKSASSEAYLPYFTLINSASHPTNPMKFEVVFTRY